jgi:antitoxin HigA-1
VERLREILTLLDVAGDVFDIWPRRLSLRMPAMPMKAPAHPGRLIQNACLEPLGLSVSEGARILGVSRPTLSSLINGRAALSAEMAIRLEKAFGSTADAWVRMQAAYDLSRARARAGSIRVRRYRG